ncbi:hypothetical protein E3P89_04088 [Wallemia ichthyophaga]|uniref:Zn(2)-C6 fungal-type domain-containing protein n=1 Tax=Wallemia ichthyophaga TaxID=245174 RepID=A0A4T0I028_WALIC|nr:hypothetical protein E3P93_04094 [Wallemia ichthyophaga]TIB07366.1 hypothetical protein E3P90_04091 [Wallemia ichthyophaga]TIB19306.1 hypothetical protein E3P89_04088 [Wallemia ichthyophaga]TIB19931.1 hypothetical protein E3P88_04096 [Wallemia ichthyophaga]
MPKAQSDTLPKGSACLACRRKKMRCDAVKPICSNCVRSGGLECIYDNESRQSARRATKLRAYEDRIRELEDKLERVKIDSSNSNSNSSSTPSTSAEPLKITTSNWPKDFPPKDMVSYLTSTFYACSPFAASDLPRQSFETRLMHLPPTSPKFPCKALCHAVFAIAFQHLPNKDPSEKHTALALEKLNEDGQSPGLMFVLERIHAAIIISQHLFSISNKADLFFPVAFAARGVIAFSLNHDTDYPRKWFLTAAGSDLEVEQRRRLFFKAYIIDQLFTLDTGINPSIIQEGHLFTPLPCTLKAFKNSTFTSRIAKSTEYVYSPNFFIQHLGDGLSLLIKALVLMGRVNDFHLRSFYDVQALCLTSGSQLVSFGELDTLIQTFRQSFPSKYSDPVRVDEDGLDIDNLMAHMIAAKCMLSLHSQFISETLSQSRLLFYSRVAINSLHKLMATTYDLTRLPSMIFTTYSSSASILVGAYIEAAKNLDIQAVSTIENELLTIVRFFKITSNCIPAAHGFLKKVEDEARKIGLDLSETEKQTQTPKQAPPLNWILPEPGSALDMSEFDEYSLLSGSSFTATDETCWMNLSTFNEM